MLALGEGEVAVPKTAGVEPAEEPETAEAEGLGEGEGDKDGLTDTLITGFTDGFAEGLGSVLGERLGKAAIFSPSTSVFWVSGCGFEGRSSDLKNNPEPKRITDRSPDKYKVGFDRLIFFISLSKKEDKESKKASLRG